jgi:hypothetical protein
MAKYRQRTEHARNVTVYTLRGHVTSVYPPLQQLLVPVTKLFYYYSRTIFRTQYHDTHFQNFINFRPIEDHDNPPERQWRYSSSLSRTTLDVPHTGIFTPGKEGR